MWLELQLFGFRALWSPFYALFILLLAATYFYITGPGRPKGEESASFKHQVFFYTGLVLLYVVKGSPVDLLGHIMFTAHMTQMALYYLLFPILIIKGLPSWIWRKLFDMKGLAPVLRLLTKPLISLLLFNGLFSMYHMPGVFDYAKSDEIAHTVITTIILITAFAMWVSVFPPLRELDRISPIMKIGFIFANGVLITPACGLIIFAEAPLYETYSEAGAWIQALSLCVPAGVLTDIASSLSGPSYFTPMPLVEDQQLGGIIMKVTQEIIFGAIIAYVFFGWFRKEGDIVDPMPSQVSTES
ncbi:cytochrome c oxidase assembly factor CtaG [Halobacillus locisalis]|uniref:Cytochrome c oxidase assembly factor CtaG n=1 Tax=Halobacillus locisalis TaxID=220753 RepID=A0A838CQN2_9BACI|nr:cytochrome c oxidase assembly factor CtaG [Halobacillus locisalis]MBA2174300.1 cytochrome c oxidase assembly factor CtaG [Halobacillus locisalis]